PALDGGRVHRRALGGRVPGQHRAVARRAARGGRRPVGRAHAGVGDRVAAAAAQLHAPAAGALVRAAAGPARGAGGGRGCRGHARARRGGRRVRPWIAVAAWAGLLALWTLLQLPFSTGATSLALLGGAAAAVAVLAVLAARGERDRPRAI